MTSWLENWAWCLLAGRPVGLQTRLLSCLDGLSSEEHRVLETLEKIPITQDLDKRQIAILWAFLGQQAVFEEHLHRAPLTPYERVQLAHTAVLSWPLETLQFLHGKVPIYVGLLIAVEIDSIVAVEYLVTHWDWEQEAPPLTPQEQARGAPTVHPEIIIRVAVLETLEKQQSHLLAPLMRLWRPSPWWEPMDEQAAELLRPCTCQIMLAYDTDQALKFLLRGTALLTADTREYLLANLQPRVNSSGVLQNFTLGHQATAFEILERLPLEPLPSVEFDPVAIDRASDQINQLLIYGFRYHLRRSKRDDLLQKLDLWVRHCVAPAVLRAESIEVSWLS